MISPIKAAVSGFAVAAGLTLAGAASRAITHRREHLGDAISLMKGRPVVANIRLLSGLWFDPAENQGTRISNTHINTNGGTAIRVEARPEPVSTSGRTTAKEKTKKGKKG